MNVPRLLVVAKECPHPLSGLAVTFVPDHDTEQHELHVLCLGCKAAWDQGNMPLDLMERVTNAIVEGRTTPAPGLDRKRSGASA
ncbi:hypothetical protein [Kutzneria buriramensis]|uniref:Uncharacterized protein n=1 Tax=Kutzneria buriramensis TaxID=1045776 RepID=A0A3E0G743_9PSEU|nr:hypothetical protein [Kutzneria buriramensis]REH18047.1 hypothetical protein BCF44_13834 [Kutzneria buriramensis]